MGFHHKMKLPVEGDWPVPAEASDCLACMEMSSRRRLRKALLFLRPSLCAVSANSASLLYLILGFFSLPIG